MWDLIPIDPLLYCLPSVSCVVNINITEKPSLCTGLFTGETRLSFIRSMEPELSIDKGINKRHIHDY